MEQILTKYRVIHKGKICGYEILTKLGWEWMSLDINPYDREIWFTGVFPSGYECMRNKFTGLKDKEGKEIYEDDVVKGSFAKGSSWTWTVKFGEIILDCCMFIGWYLEHSERDDYSSPLLSEDSKQLKVVGNIYENPELINS